MSGRGSFTTSLVWADSQGEEIEADVRVTYSRSKGFRGDHIDPPEPSSVEIVEIQPADKSITIPEHFHEDDALLAECMEDWASEEADAEEYRAEAARDRLMEGF